MRSLSFSWAAPILLLAACTHVPPATSQSDEPNATSSVGTVTLVVVDDTRRDPVDAARAREWLVQLYYPIHPTPVAGAYADDPVLLDALVAREYYFASEAQLRSWAKKPAAAVVGAKPARAAPRPLVTLSLGLGFARLNYAEIAAALVTRGYVVAVIDHPYIGISRLPDGRFLRTEDDPLLSTENPADSLPRVREWTRDVSVVIDRLSAGAADTAAPGLAIDFRQVVAVGHSIGGTAAVDVCQADARVVACIDFEGFLAGTVAAEKGAAIPTLMVLSRAKGRPPTVPPGQPDPADALLSSLAKRGQPSWIVKVTGGSHTSFSDAPDVLPETLSRFGGEWMTAARSFELYSGLVDAFARAYMDGGGDDAAFQAFLDATPEASGRRASIR
jgi:predicted dienelactone hydrolase